MKPISVLTRIDSKYLDVASQLRERGTFRVVFHESDTLINCIPSFKQTGLPYAVIIDDSFQPEEITKITTRILEQASLIMVKIPILLVEHGKTKKIYPGVDRVLKNLDAQTIEEAIRKNSDCRRIDQIKLGVRKILLEKYDPDTAVLYLLHGAQCVFCGFADRPSHFGIVEPKKVIDSLANSEKIKRSGIKFYELQTHRGYAGIPPGCFNYYLVEANSRITRECPEDVFEFFRDVIGKPREDQVVRLGKMDITHDELLYLMYSPKTSSHHVWNATEARVNGYEMVGYSVSLKDTFEADAIVVFNKDDRLLWQCHGYPFSVWKKPQELVRSEKIQRNMDEMYLLAEQGRRVNRCKGMAVCGKPCGKPENHRWHGFDDPHDCLEDCAECSHPELVVARWKEADKRVRGNRKQ